MKILILGGTGFIGQHVVRRLRNAGHDVTVFHRGQTHAALPSTIRSIHGDRRHLINFAEEFSRLTPAVVIDINPYTQSEAASVMRLFRGIARRIVALSSGDVYHVYDRFHRVVSEPPELRPLGEDAPLREHLYPYRSSAAGPEDWVYHYDKILVERTVLGDPQLPGTVLRLPMVYGPGDRQHRLFPYLKRMDDGRPAISPTHPVCVNSLALLSRLHVTKGCAAPWNGSGRMPRASSSRSNLTMSSRMLRWHYCGRKAVWGKK